MAMTPVPPRTADRSSRLPCALALAGLGLLPWACYIAVSLPPTARAAHWGAAWAGLDVLEAVALSATGLLLLWHNGWYRLAAIASATLLVVDAWFDVMTAAPGPGAVTSLAMAVFAELPLAALCTALAVGGARRFRWLAVESGPYLRAPVAGRLCGVRVLVLGSGGREHALARALARDPDVSSLIAAPGNPGIGELAELFAVTPTDPASVIALAARIKPDLVVIGPEAPLVAGIGNALRATGVACFGPDQDAAMIEGSKSLAKSVMTAAGVPTAAARTCGTAREVSAALDLFGPPYVVKADGLAAGKGVVVTDDRAAAARHAQACGTVVIEEFLDGPEVSVFALADGTAAVPLMPAQDYKRANDGDAGPNTGGMGAYAPLPWAPAGLAAETIDTIVRPTLAELSRRGTPYSGVLYVGLCLTAAGPKVVEFNARFGDPETQVVLDRLATPLAGLLTAAATGDLAGAMPTWTAGAAVTVVIAADGYPVAPLAGAEIGGIAEAERVPGAYVLHAGTAASPGGRLTAAGGRVLNVVGTGPDLARAREIAYRAAAKITLAGGWFRKDIAARPAAAARA